MGVKRLSVRFLALSKSFAHMSSSRLPREELHGVIRSATGEAEGPAAPIDTDHPDTIGHALGLGMKLVKIKSDGTEQERLVELDSHSNKMLVESGQSGFKRLTGRTMSESGLPIRHELSRNAMLTCFCSQFLCHLFVKFGKGPRAGRNF